MLFEFRKLGKAGISLLCVLLSPRAGAGEWPGSPPDCWSEPRVVHSVQAGEDRWQKRTKISIRPYAKVEPGSRSPNRAYFFIAKDYPPDAKITIYAERDHLLEIAFTDLRGITGARWINEKLIFWRVWWGRIVATDMIFDVEAEKFISTEEALDGGIAWRQYRESCPRLGCECIKKQ